jgi:hypothetical protein
MERLIGQKGSKKMKLTDEERNILLQASVILGRIYSKANGLYIENNCGVYGDFDVEDAADTCELLSRDSEINFVTEFDPDSCK